MKIRVAPRRAACCEPAPGRERRSRDLRTTVVPTATTRPPAARAASIAAQAAALTSRYSRAFRGARCRPPEPAGSTRATCSVTNAWRTRALGARRAWRRRSAGPPWALRRPRLARIDGLIALPSALRARGHIGGSAPRRKPRRIRAHRPRIPNGTGRLALEQACRAAAGQAYRGPRLEGFARAGVNQRVARRKHRSSSQFDLPAAFFVPRIRRHDPGVVEPPADLAGRNSLGRSATRGPAASRSLASSVSTGCRCGEAAGPAR